MLETHPLKHLETVLIVAIGGFAGSNLRYFVDLTISPSLMATMTVNVLGCFALGFLLYEEMYGSVISDSGRTVLATGFISSFTTYSTFIIDTVTSVPVLAVVYVIGSYTLGFAAVLIGRTGARKITGMNLETTGDSE
jgi:CrcB protein